MLNDENFNGIEPALINNGKSIDDFKLIVIEI